MEQTTVYRCGAGFEEILCGVYEAWNSGKRPDQVRLEIEDSCCELELFCEYQVVEWTKKKANTAGRAIRKICSSEQYRQIYQASLSCDEKRADKIYRYLVCISVFGRNASGMLQRQESYEIFRLCRTVLNETHHYREFVRFAQVRNKVLISRIKPENDVLPLLSPYFADRMPGENWMIYDEGRKVAAVHPAGKPWLLVRFSEAEAGEVYPLDHALREATDEALYAELWKSFFQAVSISERENPKCQRNHLPLRFRPYMTEF